MKIWLDDIRDAPDDSWTVVRTGLDAVSTIWAHLEDIEAVSFDHDLGEDSLTGYDVICEYEEWIALGITDQIPEFFIHSANPVGRKNIQAAIDSIHRLRHNRYLADPDDEVATAPVEDISYKFRGDK